MKFSLLLTGALLASVDVFARPLVLEPNQILPREAAAVANVGNDLIALETREADPNEPDLITTTANLYRRVIGGQWVFQAQLLSETASAFAGPSSVVMTHYVSAIRMPSGLHVFERTATGWAESPFDTPRPQGTLLDAELTTILITSVPGCSPAAVSVNRLANGHWGVSGQLVAPAGGCVAGFDLDGNRAAIMLSRCADPTVAATAQILEFTGAGWRVAATFESHESANGRFGPAVALKSPLALVSGSDRGAHVYRRGPSGWNEEGLLITPDSYDFPGQFSRSLQITDDYILQVGWNINRRTDVAYVYRQRADNTFEHLANLATHGPNGIGSAKIYHNRIVALQQNRPLVFDLPASFAVPPLVQEDFEIGPAGEWTPLQGSAFTIATNGTTHVYRQSSVAGDAGAVHSADLTSQSISADITPLSFNGNDRWIGLMTRHVDESNYYFVTLRYPSGRIVLKRKRNGVVTELATRAIDVEVGQRYRITLESSGTQHTVYVDGQALLMGYDSSLAHGHAGILMYRASADFDNLVVSPGPLASLALSEVVATGGTWSGTPSFLQQTSTQGEARRVSGQMREDEVVQATVSVDTFAPAGSPWVGLLARYTDDGNYYYVTARKSNQLSLRKLTNGVITELGTVNLRVVPRQAFVLRLEAIGEKLRVYVNDELKLERAGAEVRAGKVGVMTYRAAAVFDDYTAYEP